ncbi:cupin [Acetobacter orientalis]|uniref:Cupin n=1 Tax=Acetobacter orientalis TaxID=146474 RepID=A0A2Z5ZDA2_9PROT|nr:cupin [Acetobacter orientalis]
MKRSLDTKISSTDFVDKCVDYPHHPHQKRQISPPSSYCIFFSHTKQGFDF